MAYYFVAHIKITDEKTYQKYIERAEEVFKKYNGKYLSVDNSPLILEGEWDYTRSVLIKFDTKKDFENWYHSDEYQDILKHRITGAHCDTILVEGLD